MPIDIRAQYARLVAAGEIERDAAQEDVLDLLAGLEARLREHRLARKSSSLGWLFGARERREQPLRGLYLYGDVGRGKTMLMDLFFAVSAVKRKRRAHFHEFMSDVHDRVREFRNQIKLGASNGEDPIRLTASAIAEETWLLCFDEFHVTDIADAMILGRLFTRLFELGVVVVATSNVAPEELYKDGLNRALFEPFIALIEQHMQVVELSARADFRLEKLAGQPVWHLLDAKVLDGKVLDGKVLDGKVLDGKVLDGKVLDGKAAASVGACDAVLDQSWRLLTGGYAGAEVALPVKGRTLRVPRAARGAARFSFRELCEEPLAAADYLTIARTFHTLVLDCIPVMDYDARNAAKRFIILIDTLYENAVKLIASAAAEPDGLYLATEGFEAQEFKRTASRLIEMRSLAYLALPHGQRDSQASSVAEGIVET
jgi:cell division protein ZapE